MAELLLSPRDLLAARLRQMLGVELQLSEKVLPELLEQAHATDLKQSFERHLLETESHVTTVRSILHELEVPVEPEESPAFEGLLAEHEQLVTEIAGGGVLLQDLVHAQ